MQLQFIQSIREKVAEAILVTSARAHHFCMRHSNVILAVVGMLVVLHGLEQLSQAQTGGTIGAGGGTPNGPPTGGIVVGASAAGGSPISGNAVQACSRNIGYLEGGFGTLVASAAGIGAIVAAAVGGFKAAWSLFVVSVGTFILRTFLYLFLTGC